MRLYVYDHCPFCIKARMVFGLKDVPFELITLLNDDIETPTRMIGKKMLPILEKDDGSYLGESMDIVRYIDDNFGGAPVLAGPTNPEIQRWCSAAGPTLMRLSMPRWVRAPLGDFATPEAVAFFTRNKEAMIGPFDEQLANSSALIQEMQRWLNELEPLILSSQAVNGILSADDFELFPTLRMLSIVRGIEYPAKVEAYRQAMAQLTEVPLHDDIAVSA
ncbi:glutaredoxin 2 [Halotalea alkalilenta]|uniref:Glutaredoxin n=1 Tax=Halotalea alkalilenta TaxID=376489 RepID=A0A172YAU2_9GAMM|nr:glutaredoxin 2 [Halotalea alkalilenta]ANF56373.1 glutaredoxin [Halotalea alkalilenta]